jgi:hypothetical protein
VGHLGDTRGNLQHVAVATTHHGSNLAVAVISRAGNVLETVENAYVPIPDAHGHGVAGQSGRERDRLRRGVVYIVPLAQG